VKNITEIKNELVNKLGYIAVFFFLNVLYTNKEYPGPFLEVEKGLLLLYQLTSGFTSKNIKEYMPHTTFYAVYKELWIKNYENLNKYVDYCLFNVVYTLIFTGYTYDMSQLKLSNCVTD
jgi:hypothetical protein